MTEATNNNITLDALFDKMRANPATVTNLSEIHAKLLLALFQQPSSIPMKSLPNKKFNSVVTVPLRQRELRVQCSGTTLKGQQCKFQRKKSYML